MNIIYCSATPGERGVRVLEQFLSQPWSLASLVLLIVAQIAARQPAPRRPGLPLAISSSARSVVNPERVEFAIPQGVSRDAWLVIGSLADAGETLTIKLDAVRAPNLRSAVSQIVPVAFSPIKAIEAETFGRQSGGVRRPTPNSGRSPSPNGGANGRRETERTFFLQTGTNANDPASYQPVSTRLMLESAQVRIWRDELSAVADSTFPAWLADCLELGVLPRLSALYGDIADLDRDGKLSVCLTSRLGTMAGNGTPVKGLVQFNDFCGELPRPFSNHADVMFLSPSLWPGGEAQSIAAHEAAHLAVFSRRREAEPEGAAIEDDWINEGLAHYAETACGGNWSNLHERIAAFQREPQSSPLVVVDGQQQGLWRHPGSRGAAWSFFRWLANECGEEALAAVARHPQTGWQKLEQISGRPFDELFRRWSVAVCTEREIRSATNQEIVLRGTTHIAVPLPRASRGYRLTTDRIAPLQVTLVDTAVNPPRCWIVR